MIINKSLVDQIDLNSLIDYLPHNKDEFKHMSKEPYSFYAYLSTLVDNVTILDVGTRMGLSALALSYNQNNKVISYDLVEQGASNIKKQNIDFRIMDFRNDNTLIYEDIKIIMIDVDPHDGVQEKEMIEFLENINWKGILILDDILDNWPVVVRGANPQEMNILWNSLQYEKYEVSDVAHYSGTGLINFNFDSELVVKDS